MKPKDDAAAEALRPHLEHHIGSPAVGNVIATPGVEFFYRLDHKIEARAVVTDTAKAFDELQEWIERAPVDRHVRKISKAEGRWTVGLQVGEEEITASRDAELRGAIRNAIMIAILAGHK